MKSTVFTAALLAACCTAPVGARQLDPGKAPARALPAACAQAEWPAEARRYELEGATGVEYKVGKDGRVADIKLVRSSGWRLLDTMAVRTLSACKFDAAAANGGEADARYTPLEFRWALTGGYIARPELQPNSCAASERFSRFVPLDKTASGADGVLVRLLVNAKGEPFNVKLEQRTADTELAAKVGAWVSSCRFTPPSDGPDARTDTTFGRVLFKAAGSPG